MKRFLTALLMISALPVCAMDILPTVPLSDISPMSDMQTMQAQKFRQEQIDYYSDVKTEKAKYQKKLKQNQSVEQVFQEAARQNAKTIDNNASKTQMIEENGKIMLNMSRKLGD